jgi:hypothetical protein
MVRISLSYAWFIPGNRTPKRSSFGPRRGLNPASPGMLRWSDISIMSPSLYLCGWVHRFIQKCSQQPGISPTHAITTTLGCRAFQLHGHIWNHGVWRSICGRATASGDLRSVNSTAGVCHYHVRRTHVTEDPDREGCLLQRLPRNGTCACACAWNGSVACGTHMSQQALRRYPSLLYTQHDAMIRVAVFLHASFVESSRKLIRESMTCERYNGG